MSDKKYEKYFDEEECEFQTPLPTKKKNEKAIDPQDVEHYNSIEELEANLGEYDYEMVEVEELKEGIIETMLVDEAEEMDQEVLEERYNEDPFDYNTLYKLIFIYRDTKQTEKLEAIRSHTLTYFPLADQMWLEWIKDKKESLDKKSVEGRLVMLNFMKKAFSDFYYPKICVKFLKAMISMKGYSDEYSVDNIRRYYDEFLKIWNLDFNLSTGIYDSYMAFEKNNLAEAVGDQVKTNFLIKQIRSIYKRRLSNPHIDLDIIWSEYKKWETDQNELNAIELKYKEVNKINPGVSKCRKDSQLRRNI